MPKKKTVENVRPMKKPAAPKNEKNSSDTLNDAALAEKLSQFPPVFENKAGRYELVRTEAGQAYYSFTNRQNKTVDATMSLVTWLKMLERATYKETA